MNQGIIGALCLSLAAIIWGGMYVVSKYVLAFIPPITLVWLRYVIAFLVLFTFLKLKQRKDSNRSNIQTKDWLLLVWIGFIGYFLSISLQFIGTKLSDAHTAALITSSTPVFIVLLAKFVLNEPFDMRKLVSIFIATVGVVVIIGWDMKVESYFWGCITLVGTSITWALLSVYVKIASRRLSSLEITTYGILFAIVFTTPFMMWEVQSNTLLLYDGSIIAGIAYLGIVSTAVAFFLWNKGMELMDTGIGSLFFFIQPVVGSFLGWFLLDEHLYLNFYFGGSLILIGVLIVTLKKRKTNINCIKTESSSS